MEYFYEFFNAIVEFVYDSLTAFKYVIIAIFNTLTDAFKELLYDLMVSVIDFAIFLFNDLGEGLEVGLTSLFGSLPEDVKNVIRLIGLASCMGLIAVAIIIRFFLQLIPFVRLGS